MSLFRIALNASKHATSAASFTDVNADGFLDLWVVGWYERYGYLQASVLIPYIALAPSIVAGGLTLGVMQQVIRAFGRVENSFQYLVRSWTTIVSLISVYKRLRAFEATLQDKPLDLIEAEAAGVPRA